MKKTKKTKKTKHFWYPQRGVRGRASPGWARPSQPSPGQAKPAQPRPGQASPSQAKLRHQKNQKKNDILTRAHAWKWEKVDLWPAGPGRARQLVTEWSSSRARGPMCVHTRPHTHLFLGFAGLAWAWNSNRWSDTEQKDLPQKGVLLRKISFDRNSKS